MSAQDQLQYDLARWFTEQGFRTKHLRWEDCDNYDGRRAVFATTKNNYFVNFRAKSTYPSSPAPEKIEGGYLGMTASSRLARPGENWLRGNDLPDGKFCKETFDRMMDAVLMYELREVSNVNSPPPWHMQGAKKDATSEVTVNEE